MACTADPLVNGGTVRACWRWEGISLWKQRTFTPMRNNNQRWCDFSLRQIYKTFLASDPFRAEKLKLKIFIWKFPSKHVEGFSPLTLLCLWVKGFNWGKILQNISHNLNWIQEPSVIIKALEIYSLHFDLM